MGTPCVSRGASRAARPGFTLPEVVLAVAIGGVLLAILLPTVFKLRQHSRDVVCQSRLRNLALATAAFEVERGQLPGAAAPPAAAPPATAATLPIPSLPAILPPTQVDVGLLNQLGPAVGFRRISVGALAIDLPPEVQSPEVEGAADGAGPATGSASGTYYTGFAYTAGLYDPAGRLLSSLPLPLLPVGPTTAAPPARPPAPSRRTLWADDLHMVAAGPRAGDWGYAHAERNATVGRGPLSYSAGAGCRGQHRAYADGSSAWVPAAALNLSPSAPRAGGHPAVRVGTDYVWFWEVPTP